MKRRPVSETKDTLRGLLLAYTSYSKLRRRNEIPEFDSQDLVWIAGFIEGLRYATSVEPVPHVVNKFVVTASADPNFGKADA